MLRQVDIDTAASERWDVIVAGSSFASMFFVWALPPNLRVLVVEKGGIHEHSSQLDGWWPPQPDFTPVIAEGHDKEWVAHTMFGGNSNCWWGQAPRFHPADFDLFDRHGHAAPWPIGYDDLEPLYAEVEEVMEIAGGGSDQIMPRSRPFPYPPHTPGRSDRLCIESRPDIWVPAPTARSNGGTRPVCCANGVCHLCPIDSKFTVLNAIDRFQRPGVALVTETEAIQVDIANGQASALIVRNRGRQMPLRGDVIALGTNAIFNAAIALRSGLTSPALGRYLHEQASVTVTVDVAVPGLFGGTSIPAHCYGFYEGDHRAERAAVLVESYNAPSPRLRPERNRWTNAMMLKLIAEELPRPDDRVVVRPDGRVEVIWTGHSDYSQAGLAWARDQIATILPFEVDGVRDIVPSRTEAHIQGTHRMGRDPQASVTDASLRCHEVSNLVLLGAGAFPSCAPANPTLTLSALSLAAGRAL